LVLEAAGMTTWDWTFDELFTFGSSNIWAACLDWDGGIQRTYDALRGFAYTPMIRERVLGASKTPKHKRKITTLISSSYIRTQDSLRRSKAKPPVFTDQNGQAYSQFRLHPGHFTERQTV